MASDSLAFTAAKLFGGAITASIPSTFIDASDLRQIPDNQEVFVDSNGLASITFDILEKVDTSDMEEAIAIHLGEVVEADPAEVVEMSGSNDTLGSMRYVVCSVEILLYGLALFSLTYR
jgi:Ran-interacting Mog1 protein